MNAKRRVLLLLAVMALSAVGIAVIAQAIVFEPRGSAVPAKSPVFVDRFRGEVVRPDELVWDQVAGHWSVGSNSATFVPQAESSFELERVDAEERMIVSGLLLHDMSEKADSVSVTLSRSGNGCGLAFRFRDTRNFWFVATAPGFATWSIYAVEDGRTRYVANTGTSATNDSTRVTVIDRGNELKFYVESFDLGPASTASVSATSMTGRSSAGPLGLSSCATGAWSNYIESR